MLTSGSKGAPIMDVDRTNNVLGVKVLRHRATVMGMPRQATMSVINSPEYESDSDVQCGTLMHFHRRLGHLCFDTIIQMSKDPASCIKLTDTRRVNCLACAQGKQTKQAQSKVDTGMNSPIDVIGGVICSDLKGPMTPRDRLGNRYLVNFIDHRSNYCHVFLAKTKDAAALKFKYFLVQFEREFNYKIHVLRTDGGGEYKTLDVFCKATDVPAGLLSLGRLQAMYSFADVPEHCHHPVHRRHGRCRLLFELFPGGLVRTVGNLGRFGLCSRTALALDRWAHNLLEVA